MSDDVVSLGKFTGDAKFMSPEQTLRNALADIGKEGALKKGTKLIVLAVDDFNSTYNINFYQSGMKMSECVTLCELGKMRFLEQMDFFQPERD